MPRKLSHFEKQNTQESSPAKTPVLPIANGIKSLADRRRRLSTGFSLTISTPYSNENKVASRNSSVINISNYGEEKINEVLKEYEDC